MSKISQKIFSEILEIDQKSFKYSLTPKTLGSYFSKFHLLTIRKNKKTIAYAFHQIKKDRIFINRIAVSPDFRRKGIGTKIMNKIIKKAKALKLTKIRLYTRISNVRAITFYQKFNFKKNKKIEKYYPRGERSAFVLEKKL